MITRALSGLLSCATLRLIFLVPVITIVWPAEPTIGRVPTEVSPELHALEGQISGVYHGMLTLRGSANWTPERDRAQATEIEDAVTDYIVTRLNASPSPPARSLEWEINEALAQGFGGKSYEDFRRDAGSPPSAYVLQDGGTTPALYIAVFRTDPGNTPSNAIRDFALRGGRFEMVASAGTEWKHRLVTALRLRSFAPTELRFMVYGLYIGSPEALTNLVVYSFDGTKLDSLWKQESVPHAKVSILNDQIVVDSIDEGVPKRFHTPWDSTRVFYNQVSGGLKPAKVEHGKVR